jgi:hypothetical protein
MVQAAIQDIENGQITQGINLLIAANNLAQQSGNSPDSSQYA